MKNLPQHEYRTWIEIDTKAVDHNIGVARKLLPADTKIMGIVKSNAYGHGLFDFAAYITKHGVEWLGVDSVVEALALRKEGVKVPMLVMGYSLPMYFKDAVRKNISITVSNFETLEQVFAFSKSKKLRIHIKIDTGLHRQGFLPEEVPALLERLKALRDRVCIEGLYTHLADAKRMEGEGYSNEQKKVFADVKKQFAEAGFSVMSHVSASPALLRFGTEGEDIVRLGALLYGIYPSGELEDNYKKTIELKPAFTWKTMITELKKIPKGSSVGYNRSEIVTRDTIIGICPVGYWHGYPAALSSKGVVLVGQSKTPAKVLGRVTMDMTTIDCTDCKDVRVGDEVVLVDATEGSKASARQVAETAGTFVHELVTRTNSRIKHIYL